MYMVKLSYAVLLTAWVTVGMSSDLALADALQRDIPMASDVVQHGFDVRKTLEPDSVTDRITSWANLKRASSQLRKAEQQAQKASTAFEQNKSKITDWLKPHVAFGAIAYILEGDTIVTADPSEICNAQNIKEELVEISKKLPWPGYCLVDQNLSFSRCRRAA